VSSAFHSTFPVFRNCTRWSVLCFPFYISSFSELYQVKCPLLSILHFQFFGTVPGEVSSAFHSTFPRFS
jgi:hypothetical protein